MLERFVCGRTRSNAYLMAPDGGRQALIVDAGPGAAARVMDVVGAEGLEPQALLLTHGHPDHIWTARQLADHYEIPVYIHAADVRWLSDPATGGHLPGIRLAGRALGRARRMRPRRLHVVEDGEVIEAAGLRISVLHTPGHSRGSACYQLDLDQDAPPGAPSDQDAPPGAPCDRLCFAGDTIFCGSVGRAIFPGGNPSALRESLRSKLLGLPDELRLLPGHGVETVVGAEREGWRRYIGEG